MKQLLEAKARREKQDAQLAQDRGKVIVVWFTNAETIHVLTSYAGVRVYSRDVLDGRIPTPCPYVPGSAELAAYMEKPENWGYNKPVQIPLWLGRKIFDDYNFAVMS